MAQHIEKGTNYAYTVERMKELSFRSLRSVSVEFTKRLPVELSSELYTNIQHGVCQLQSEPELNMYIHALGLMHEAKLQYAFEHLSDDFINHQTWILNSKPQAVPFRNHKTNNQLYLL